MQNGEEKKFSLASEYVFSKTGNVFILETTRRNADSNSKALILWVSPATGRVDTVLRGFHDAVNYALDEAGTQLAFAAERDSVPKALRKFYHLWYYWPGKDSAVKLPEETGWQPTITISPDYANNFSKDGRRLFVGLAPVRPPKDTTLVDFETARLDVWNYKDDYLAPQQLVQLKEELKRSFPAEYTAGAGASAHDLKPVRLTDEDCESLILPRDGIGPFALGQSTRGYRIQQQWEESGLRKLYLVDMATGERKLIQDKVRGGAIFSPGGQFVCWYDWKKKNWFSYRVQDGTIHNFTAGIKTPLYDEEDDHPDDPPPHGIMGWQDGDRSVYVYDKFDIWQCDPSGSGSPVNLTHSVGRARGQTLRYIPLDREDPFIHPGRPVLLTIFDHKDKTSGLLLWKPGDLLMQDPTTRWTFPASFSGFIKAKMSWQLGWISGSFDKPNDVWLSGSADSDRLAVADAKQYSHINPQQASYNWYTVELHHWKMLDGRMSEGLLYKPENFDSTKKYPVIFYFYERDADTRFNYQAPQPVRASINIPYFVSNGYLVFDPNIYYKTGQPGEDAYNSVVSAARYLEHFKWVDSTKMGLQGHSWGGYQVAYLVTRTHFFAAAEAGAPVANMTSAYGGIRWGAGISRQFQYERSQSRIGSTLWEHPELYIRNSPLFRADKVTTPLLMMHNDADGAVPWYQGIEYFSALRRLGKKAWLIEYNGEDHGLAERRNRKDWSIRLFQFFNYYLKDQPPARWIAEGVPATLKGVDWGLATEPSKPGSPQ
jgi:dipeptidyl aminopeptidase/acylaminoacyl peptidase